MTVPTPGQMAVPIAAPVEPAVVAAVMPPVIAPTPPHARVAIGLRFTSEDPQLGQFGFLIVFCSFDIHGLASAFLRLQGMAFNVISV